MKRRTFLQSTLAAAIIGGMTDGLRSGLSLVDDQFDRFGGWKGKQFEPTGFFRVEKEKRWWIVTPEGNAFLSFGINHLHSDWWKQAYNRDAWQKRLGLTDLNSPEFGPTLRTWFLETCTEYGFNTIGMHNSLAILNQPQPNMPYLQHIRFVDIPHWKEEVPDEHFLDIFSPGFVKHCDQLAREIAGPRKDDPFLLAYAMTDCPLLTEEDCRERTDVIGGARRKARIGWPRRLRNLGGDAPGKQAYVLTMREVYGEEIEAFNATYDTEFDSFDALASAEQWRPHTALSNPHETRDNTVFLQRVVEQYYRTTRDAIQRYDPNHMFVGDKLNANTDTLDTVLPITNRFTDITFYQMYARYELQETGLDRWAGMVDQPIINGDAAFTMITPHMPRPFGPIADTIEQRAEWTEEFFRKAFARPEFVGWHYCGLIDATNQVARKQDRQHSGLMNGYGEPYSMLKTVIQNCADKLYQVATGNP